MGVILNIEVTSISISMKPRHTRWETGRDIDMQMLSVLKHNNDGGLVRAGVLLVDVSD